jgi:hypothetical protein
MKNLLLLSALLLSLTLNAQWETNYFVDDFGDKTEKGYESIMAEGTFSNSATSGSKASYKFIHDKGDKTVTLKVLEYGRSLATSTDSVFTIVKIKTPSGEIVKIKSVMFSKTGVLFFYKKSYDELLKTMAISGDHTMVFERKGSYSSDSYKVKFSID